MTDVNFSDLAERSGQLMDRFATTFHGINYDRSLKELGETSRLLNDITSSKSIPYNESYQKAINKYKIEPKVIGESLENISTASFIDVETVPTDVEQFLKGEFESMIMNSIHDVQKRTNKEFTNNYQQSSLSEWARDKKTLEETLGQRFVKVHKQQQIDLGGSSMMASGRRSVSPAMLMSGGSQLQLPQPQQMQQQQQQQQSMFMSNAGGFSGQLALTMKGEEKTKLSNKMRAYAQVVFECLQADKSNVGGGHEQNYPFVQRLMDAHLAGTTKNRQVIEDLWILIEKLTERTGAAPPAETKMIGLVRRTIQFLEEQFVNTMKTRIPTISNISSPLEEVVSYINSNVQHPQTDPGETYRNCSIWSIIYYSMRAGYHQVVLELTAHLGRYRDLIRNIVTARREGDGKCPQELTNKMAQEYRVVRNESKDYFKIAVFNLLSMVDATNVHSNTILFPFIQDLIWWRLSFIRYQAYSLQSLQMDINDTLSQTPFDPMVLFQIHLLTCQYELGIAHLSLGNQEDALHFALALDHASLLNKPRPDQTFVDSSDIYNQSSGTLNVVAMIRQYIRSFSSETDNTEALYYYLFIDNDQIQTACISDLIVTSTCDTDFARHLLTMPDFIRKDQWRRIIEHTALTYESRSNYQLAISYWLLIEEYARVLDLYNNRMSILLKSVSVEKDQLYQFGLELFNDRQLQIKISHSDKSSYLAFEQLLQLADFFNLYNKERYQEALDLLDRLSILPIVERDVEMAVENYRFLSGCITKNFSAIIEATIDIIMRLYQLVALPMNQAYLPPATTQLYAGRQKTIDDIQSRAQSLTQFAGKIDFPMSSNTLTKLMNFMVTIRK
ncbi:hypothetical protein SAMD00019534_038430 [Acytostelium subglobosum LB1]|uniref:hypothetical protein n=1 Tax=Acytostelium subglobosum LB1 TaxID=1410327 RepID=UPI000645075C|nr:hypothetical protein SAMD00019534_038430 [Acytostelium subglobosum LB1]GAM20668.1 hypothetical protein SAMD00019534_038430 [Acytostelium subglobosum LB1]|eukprot:XP_012760189.1 hypothetical protein SAMD00019534_038430 [Acytostelium subglobosum LB1]